jgi:hypothetical protein
MVNAIFGGIRPPARCGRRGSSALGSAADDKQPDGEDEDDELESDADGVLEAAHQTLVADGEPRATESRPPPTRSTPSQLGTRRSPVSSI